MLVSICRTRPHRRLWTRRCGRVPEEQAPGGAGDASEGRRVTSTLNRLPLYPEPEPRNPELEPLNAEREGLHGSRPIL